MATLADEPLDYSERWLRDGLHVLRPAFSAMQISVDMTHALRRLDDLRGEGVQASTTHLLVRAAAIALAANPDLHQVVAGSRRHRPARVDIGLSVAGETCVAPVLVLEGVDQKTVAEIAAETASRVPEIREVDRRMRRTLNRWGWVVPFGFLRRWLLSLLFANAAFRCKGTGALQVSTVPVDWALASTFASSGVLIGGQVRSRVVVVDGQPAVRPVMLLTLSADHGVWDGRAGAKFLAAVKSELEAVHRSVKAEAILRPPHSLALVGVLQ